MAEIKISTRAGEMRAWLETPRTNPPWPGVVVLHDIAGMSDDLRRHAQWLAGEGFLALAPDLFSPGGKTGCFFSLLRDSKARNARFIADIEASRDWLARNPQCSGKVGVVGFSMGGNFALMLAPGHGFSASSVNYGGPIPPDAATKLAGACPIIGSYGAKDRSGVGAAAQLEQVQTQLGIDHDVKEYPDAGHSFLNNHRSRFLRMMMKLAGMGYHAPSAEDARRRIAAFFHWHLD